MPQVRDIQFATYGETVLHPVAAAVLLGCVAAIFCVRRSRMFFPVLVVATQLPFQQRVVVAGLDFSMLRIVVLAGLFRLLVTGGFRGFRWRKLDTAFLVWVCCSILFPYLREQTSAILINRAGWAIDAAGTYFLVRASVRTIEHYREALICLAVLAIPIALLLLAEWSTGRNPVGFMGGQLITTVRDGKLRCKGAFGHSILAGSYAASMLPLFVSLFMASPRARPLAALAAGCTVFSVLTTSSSGPALCLLTALGMAALWPLRRWRALMAWIVMLGALMIHLIREKPVWHIIGRLSELIGGTGYHRVRLIDATVNNFSDWAWVGTTKARTAEWGWGLQDTTNWFVSNAIQGGLATLLSFTLLLIIACRLCSGAIRTASLRDPVAPRSPRTVDYFAWGALCSLAVHAMAWISVSYFGTMQGIFFAQLGLIGVLARSPSELAPTPATSTFPGLRHWIRGSNEPRWIPTTAERPHGGDAAAP